MYVDKTSSGGSIRQRIIRGDERKEKTQQNVEITSRHAPRSEQVVFIIIS